MGKSTCAMGEAIASVHVHTIREEAKLLPLGAHLLID